MINCGSPPQVWGKLVGRRGADNRIRFTPTGVGKTPSRELILSVHEVHPHRCGENQFRSIDMPRGQGSPPQVWGKRRHHSGVSNGYRFTPTGVGKTVGRRAVGRYDEVHPHRCGENNRGWGIEYRPVGSPPQVWGKLPRYMVEVSIERFTPTGVGKTWKTISDFYMITVHPHRCGENAIQCKSNHLAHGSPPQVWGKLPALMPYMPKQRFTPTGVGKTLRLTGSVSAR